VVGSVPMLGSVRDEKSKMETTVKLKVNTT
jgi:hypothetical protein